MTGTKTARPGSSMRLNFPMRSTIHAVCCGTNRITVFVGKRLCDEKYEGGPDGELNWPSEPKTLVGLPEADCEPSCEKLRAHDVVKAVVKGDALEMFKGRELRSRLEPVEATKRVRDAILWVEATGDDGHAELREVPPTSADRCDETADSADIINSCLTTPSLVPLSTLESGWSGSLYGLS